MPNNNNVALNNVNDNNALIDDNHNNNHVSDNNNNNHNNNDNVIFSDSDDDHEWVLYNNNNKLEAIDNGYTWIIPYFNEILDEASPQFNNVNNIKTNKYNLLHNNVDEANLKKVISPIFNLHGFQWRLLLFPYGHRYANGFQSNPTGLSCYLELMGREGENILPVNCDKYALGGDLSSEFRIVLVHPSGNNLLDKERESRNIWQPRYDCGYNELCPQYDIRNLIHNATFNVNHNNNTNVTNNNEATNNCDIKLDNINTCVKDNNIANSLVVKCFIEFTNNTDSNSSNNQYKFNNVNNNNTNNVLTGVNVNGNFVGLQNQGSTCYMNSLLQTLFHIPDFRHAVYSIDTSNNNNNNQSKSIVLALQKLFYQLQTGYSNSTHAINTKELTDAFGWDSGQAFQQHDIQEFSRVLIDSIDNIINKSTNNTTSNDNNIGINNGTTVKSIISKLFEGLSESYIDCIKVDFSSNRREPFLDLSLNVKNLSRLRDSFKQYTSIEILEGDNEYRSDVHGLQPAKKGSRFIHFPFILQIQLKRFEYDQSGGMKKINDTFAFPTKINLTKFEHNTDNNTVNNDNDRAIYYLHSVLVHSGSGLGGHYYSFIRPLINNNYDINIDEPGLSLNNNDKSMNYNNNNWYKFDDSNVSISNYNEAVRDNFGGNISKHKQWLGQIKSEQINYSYHSAYMLVYLRESAVNKSISYYQNLVKIPKSLCDRFELEAKRLIEAQQQAQTQHLYTTIKTVCEQQIIQYCESNNNHNNYINKGIGCELYGFGMSIHNNKINDIIGIPTTFAFTEIVRVLKTCTPATVYNDLNAHYTNNHNISIAKESMQLWRIVTRENETNRPKRFVYSSTHSNNDSHNPFYSVYSNNNKLHTFYIRSTLYDSINNYNLGAAINYSISDINEDNNINSNDRRLLLIKYFNVEKQIIQFLGSILIFKNHKPTVIQQWVARRIKLIQLQNANDNTDNNNCVDINVLISKVNCIPSEGLNYSSYILYDEECYKKGLFKQINNNKTIQENELRNGDIICVQFDNGNNNNTDNNNDNSPINNISQQHQLYNTYLQYLKSRYTNAFESNIINDCIAFDYNSMSCNNYYFPNLSSYLNYHKNRIIVKFRCTSLLNSINQPIQPISISLECMNNQKCDDILDSLACICDVKYSNRIRMKYESNNNDPIHISDTNQTLQQIIQYTLKQLNNNNYNNNNIGSSINSVPYILDGCTYLNFLCSLSLVPTFNNDDHNHNNIKISNNNMAFEFIDYTINNELSIPIIHNLSYIHLPKPHNTIQLFNYLNQLFTQLIKAHKQFQANIKSLTTNSNNNHTNEIKSGDKRKQHHIGNGDLSNGNKRIKSDDQCKSNECEDFDINGCTPNYALSLILSFSNRDRGAAQVISNINTDNIIPLQQLIDKLNPNNYDNTSNINNNNNNNNEARKRTPTVRLYITNNSNSNNELGNNIIWIDRIHKIRSSNNSMYSINNNNNNRDVLLYEDNTNTNNVKNSCTCEYYDLPKYPLYYTNNTNQLNNITIKQLLINNFGFDKEHNYCIGKVIPIKTTNHAEYNFIPLQDDELIINTLLSNIDEQQESNYYGLFDASFLSPFKSKYPTIDYYSYIYDKKQQLMLKQMSKRDILLQNNANKQKNNNNYLNNNNNTWSANRVLKINTD